MSNLKNDPFYWNGYVAYRVYLAVQLHFNSPKYDYFHYKGAVRATEESFMKRNDKYWFAKFAKDKTIEETEDMLVASFLDKGTLWIGDMNADAASTAYVKWQKQFQNFSYIFANDLDTIFEKAKTFQEPFRPLNKQIPLVIEMSQRKQIQDVSVVALDALTSFMNFIDPLIDDPYIWKRYKSRYDKAKPFFLRRMNQEKAKKIVQQKLGHLN